MKKNFKWVKNLFIMKKYGIFAVIIGTIFCVGTKNVNAAREVYTYSYTGEYQEFVAPTSSRFRIQLWGAQGGNYDTSLLGGLGGYTEGIIDLTKGTKLYVYVGGQPSSSQSNLYGGWNGGGDCPAGKDKDGRAGGGATDIRTIPTTSKTVWNATDSLASRIMVASGGGGAAYESTATWRSDGGPAGGLTGYTPLSMGSSAGQQYGTGASQIAGGYAVNAKTTAVAIGTFGKGGRGISTDGGSGGGGGWFGGGGSNICSGGGGGSSYISGHVGCIAANSNGTTIDTSVVTTNQSHSWTGYVFSDTKIIDGRGYDWTNIKGGVVNQPTQNNLDTQLGNYGNGFARISSLRELYSDNTLKSLTSDKGEWNPTFESSQFEYDLVIDTYDKEVELFAEPNEEHATVEGLGKYAIKYKETKTVELIVTAESGDIQIYTINIKRKPMEGHSTKLAELELINESKEIFKFNPDFDSNVLEYTMDIGYNTLEVELEAVAYDYDATVKIEGNGLILKKEGDITITVSAPDCEDTVYTIHYVKGEQAEPSYDYNYTGNYQTFVAPSVGRYKIELWGSQGASGAKPGGYGAYTKGNIFLQKGETLYIYVGNNVAHGASFNGGAIGASYGFSGGGATDIRLTSGTWNDFDSLKSRIMVAAGGGGSENWSGASHGGAAGGLFAYDIPYYATGSWAYSLGTGGSQTSGGKGFSGRNQSGANGAFGYAGRGGSSYGGGGGSGYYGGAGGGDGGPMTSAGTGGSSFISGHPGCNAIKESSTASNIEHADTNIHYSNKVFTETVMIDGLGYSWIDAKTLPKYTVNASNGSHVTLQAGEYTGQPSHNSDEIVTGHTGNGFARITPLFLKSENNYLTDIETSSGTLSPTFDPTKNEYDLILDKEIREVDIKGILSDETASVTGDGHFVIKYGKTVTAKLVVTSESGDLRTYTVNIKREELKDGEHSSLLADLDFKVDETDVEPAMDPSFHSNTFEYNIVIAPNMIYLDVDAVPFDTEATVKIEGNGLIISEVGEIVITVSEPNSSDTIYKIKYTREEKPDDEYIYNYTGDYQTFIAPLRGNYRFELWGSQGASGRKAGGLGAYTKGDIFLEKGETLYIYVGNSVLHGNSFNGGAIGRTNGFGGGGATDIRLVSGPWNDFDSLKSRIMVASGGGGAENWNGASNGGAAGGLYSYDVPYYASGSWSYTLNTGATQTSGGTGMRGYYQNGTNGSFGYAGAGGNTYGGGGGSGYYSGAGGGDGGPMTAAGSGGSSYISGHPGCNSITENSTATSITHSGLTTHYSNKVFKNTVMIDGLGFSWTSADSKPTYTSNAGSGNSATLQASDYTGQPTIKGDDIQVGKEGLGYAKVTPLFQSKNNYLMNLETNYGTFDKEFSPFETEYTLTLDKYEQHFTLTGETADKDAIVTGLGKYEVHLGETKVVSIDVTAPNGEVRTYTIKVTRGNLADGEHSTKLVSLKINKDKFALKPEFISIETKYKLEVPYSTMVLDVEAIPYDKTAQIKIEGNGYLKPDGDNVVKITITHPDVPTTVYEVVVTREEDVEGTTEEFTCTNGYQIFTAPGSTYYKAQLWGASGGYGRTDWSLKYRGGLGAYTEGEIYLSKGQKVYVYVGCTGVDGGTELSHIGGAGGWNGGAAGGDDSNRDSAPEPGGGGGGATDLRLTPTSSISKWNEFDSLKSRIMVASGGGGGNYYGIGGAGGALVGTTGYGNKNVPNQEGGYAFGFGMKGPAASDGAGGGAGGYFGGYSNTSQAGGGGASFVSGCENCIAIDQSSTVNHIISTGQNKHYSNFVFDKIQIKSGEEVQPNQEGGFQTGNTGDGHAILTAVKARSENNFLKSLTVDKGTLDPEFDLLTRDYTVIVGEDDTKITIDAKVDDEKATLSGTGTFDVEAGENHYSIFVTAENGDIRVYTVKVIREKSSNAMALDIEINGLVPTFCDAKEEYCNLTPEFHPDTDTYTMTIPNKIRQLEFVVKKANQYQTVTGDGIKLLEQGNNVIVIEVTSEDGTRKANYTYNIVRDMSGDANLENLVVVTPPTDIKFNPEVSDYYFSVPDTISELELEITLEDSNASYEVIGNENFEHGMNIVQIVVTAQNKDTKTYTLNVYKEQSGNTFLSDIKVSHDKTNYPLIPNYNKVIGNYIVNVPNEVDNVDITATPEHTLTTVTGTGNVKLNTGTNKVTLSSTATDGSVQLYELYIVRAKSSDATLKSLDVLEGLLDPEFDPEVEEYNIDVNSKITSLTLNPVVNNEKAKYKISGNSGFVLGTNKVVILVTAEDGTKKTYTLNVNKVASNNNYLSNLVIDKYDMTQLFNKEQEEYYLVFEEKTPTIKVSATPEDPKAKVTKTGIYNIKTGSNIINILVTAEDGSQRTYKLNIFQTGNSNNNLISLVTSSTKAFTPAFTSGNTKYQLEVENTEDEITVIGIAEDKNATVTGNGNYHLDTGVNTILITVMSEEGTEKIYELNVTRAKSNNANASLIIAKESVLDPIFDKDTLKYELKVLEEVTSLDLEVDLEDDAATYEVIGNKDFVIGHNTVTVRVKAEDGTTKDYVLDVIRQEKGTTSDKLESLTVDKGTLTPTFEPEVVYYEVEVPYEVDKITLSGVLEDKNAEVEGLGEYTLAFGKNVLGVMVTSTEGVVRSYQVVVTRNRKTEARLASLQVTDTTLDPNFDKDVFEYDLKTNETSLQIKAVPLDKNATFKIIGNSNLTVGSNDVIVRVTAEDGTTTQDYILHVTYEKSLNNNLKLLEIDSVTMTPEFSKTTTVYHATVGHDVNNIIINAVPEDPRSTVGGEGTIDLNMGVNYLDITVTSEAGTKKVYTLIVTREADSNNYLSSLIPSSGTLDPTFEKETNEYTVTVPYEVEDIIMSGTLENTNAAVTGLQKYSLSVGDNDIFVTVTAEDGSTNIYHVVVTRENIVSSQLKNITIDNYKLEEVFSSDLYDYNVTIDYEVQSLNLHIETLDQNATYEVFGNENLKVGMNTITIVVTDSLGVGTSTYTLNVNKQNYSNNFLNYIYTSVGELRPNFTREVLSYTVEVENEIKGITIFAEPEVSTNIVTGTGHHDLNPGDNEIQVVVTSPNGIKRTYYVNVKRKKNASNDLATLVVKADGIVQTLTPAFDKDTLEYNVTVNAGISSVDILATTSSNASLSGIGTKEIHAGNNKLDVVVTSEDGVVKTYVINVTRQASDNNKLLNIIPSVGTLAPVFSSDQLEYTLLLDASSSMLSFNVVTEDRFATVSGIETMLIPDGASTREIKVTSESGKELTYTINVYKDRTDEARLSNLEITGLTFNEPFDPDTFNYTVTVLNDYNTLLQSDVIATAVDNRATITKGNTLTLSTKEINIYSVIVTAKDGFTKQTYTIEITREKGSVALLDKLSFDIGVLKPDFDKNTFEYTLTVDNDVAEIKKEQVTAIATDPDADVTMPDKLTITDDTDNLYEIKVKSADESNENIYQIHVKHKGSSDASLKSLTVDHGTLTPDFSSTEHSYVVNVLDTLDSINITAVTNDPNARILTDTSSISLDNYTTEVNITVQAEDGTLEIYTVTINKNITTKKYLSNLYISGDKVTSHNHTMKPKFSEEEFNYTIEVNDTVDVLDIIAVKLDENQIVKYYKGEEEISNENITIATGLNTFKVEVTNGLNEKVYYTLEINRKKSSNNYLENLIVKNPAIDLEFNRDTMEYFITVESNVTDVELEYVCENDACTVSITNDKNLKKGNNDVVVLVTAEDGSTRTYIVHVLKKSDDDAYLSSLTINDGLYPLSPDFHEGTFEYFVTLTSDVETITIGATAKDGITITGTGEKNIKYGQNVFKVITSSTNGATNTYTVVVNRTTPSHLYLESLSPTIGSLNETFVKTDFTYTMNVDANITNIDFNVVPELSTTTVEILGNKNLVTGKNIISIILTNSDKSLTTTYKVEVNKEKSGDNYLKSLKVDDEELITEETYEETEFNVTVSYDKETVEIKAIPNNNVSMITNDGIHSLGFGENKIQVQVISEDGTLRTYTVNVIREYNNHLLMISTNRGDLTPTFDKDTLDYYLDVNKEITDITILAVQESMLTTITGNGYHTLEMGENLIDVVVSSKDGTSKTYTLHVTRNKSDNNYLKSLFVHEGVLIEGFDKDLQEYHVIVPNGTTELTIDATVEDESATYSIVGNSGLTTGENRVKVKVTSEMGTTREYVIVVTVSDSATFSNRLTSLTVDKGTLTPVFDPDTISYTVNVPMDTKEITVSGALESIDATATGFGTYPLKSGRNEIQIVVTSKDKKIKTYSVIVNRELSDDARLKVVTFDKGKITPIFDKDQDTYQVTIESDVTELVEHVEPVVSGTTYTITGNKVINTQSSVITIVATSENKLSTKTYTFNVEKEVSTNNYLASLTSNIGTIIPSFEKTNTGPYIIDVDEKINSIILNGKVDDKNATVAGLGIHNLNKGTNKILIVVTSEDGTPRTYTVIVNRASNSDNNLSSLTVGDYKLTPVFDKDETEYHVTVDSDLKEVSVLGVASNPKATVSGNDTYTLNYGDNVVNIIVTAEDGSTKTYTVRIDRPVVVSSKLLDIKAKEGKLTPTFDKNKLEYMITVPNEVTSLTFSIKKEDENATIAINGNENFVPGSNKVEIVVTGTDHSTTTYELTVVRQAASNNYLESLTVSEGTLSPTFGKKTIYYEVDVENSITSIDVTGVSEDKNATVTGLGTYSLLPGENYIYVNVTSKTGVVRTYTIKVTREKSNVNTLKTLEIHPGTLTPSFDPDTFEYTVEYGEGVKEVEITATADTLATITGTGKKSVVTGLNRYEVVVTAEDGSVNTYVIIATKTPSSNTNITNIIPSSGTLTPGYNDSIDSYDVRVSEDVAIIDFDVMLESPTAVVSGDKNNYLNYGENDITITVTAEDGTTKDVHIHVIREKEISEIKLDGPILMEVGEQITLTPTILPVDASNKELVYETLDPTIVDVTDGVVTGLRLGDTIITVSSKQNPNVKKTINVSVLNLKITSDIYDVRRDILNLSDEGAIKNIVIGAEENEMLDVFLTKLKNKESLIKFYDKDGTLIEDLATTKIATAQIIKLEYDGKVYDTAYIAVRGENTFNGRIDIDDLELIDNQILGLSRYPNDSLIFKVSDVVESDKVDVDDSDKLEQYILGKIKTLNSSNNENE